MNNSPQSSSSEQFVITLDIVPEDPRDAEPAWVDAIRRDTENALEHDGYTIEHPYTGIRGGPHPAELITTITQAASYAWDHRNVAEEVVNDLSSLVTIFGGVTPVVKRLFQSHQRRASKESIPQAPIKITVEIDGAPVSVEAPDVEQAKAALSLAQKYHSRHPNKKVTTKSSVNVTGNIPKRKSRPRR